MMRNMFTKINIPNIKQPYPPLFEDTKEQREVLDLLFKDRVRWGMFGYIVDEKAKVAYNSTTQLLRIGSPFIADEPKVEFFTLADPDVHIKIAECLLKHGVKWQIDQSKNL